MLGRRDDAVCKESIFFDDILHIIKLKRVSVVSSKWRQLCARDQGGFVVGYIEAHATLIGSTSIVEVAWSTSHGPFYWNRIARFMYIY